jgi:hypothetical protein
MACQGKYFEFPFSFLYEIASRREILFFSFLLVRIEHVCHMYFLHYLSKDVQTHPIM